MNYEFAKWVNGPLSTELSDDISWLLDEKHLIVSNKGTFFVSDIIKNKYLPELFELYNPKIWHIINDVIGSVKPQELTTVTDDLLKYFKLGDSTNM